MLDGVAEPVQEPTPGLPPHEKTSFRAQPIDQLVVDDVGRHPDEGQVAALLPDQLVARRMRDQVRESLERDDVAVSNEVANGYGERNDLRHAGSFGLEGERVRTALDRHPVEVCELADRGAPAETTDPAVLDSAERHLGLVGDRLVVDVDDPGLDLLGQGQPAVGSDVMIPAERP